MTWVDQNRIKYHWWGTSLGCCIYTLV